MAATFMTVEFGTINHFSSLKKILKFVCAVLQTDTTINWNYVNYNILVLNNHVLNINMNTN